MFHIDIPANWMGRLHYVETILKVYQDDTINLINIKNHFLNFLAKFPDEL